jgi:signal recognition particle receptor subunit beta
MPLDLGTVAGMRTKFHIYTVPGQVYYNSTRKLVLLGADGIIFVADSSPKAMEANKQSLENLKENLIEMGKDIAKVPLVLQWNKRDIPDAVPTEVMESELNTYKVPSFEAVASKSEGVIQTLKGISALVLESINSNERAGAAGATGIAGATAVAAKPMPTAAPAAPAPAPAPAAAAPPDDIAGQIERNHVPDAQPVQPAAAAAAAPQQPVPPNMPPQVAPPNMEQVAPTATATMPEEPQVAPLPQPRAQPPQPQAAAAPPPPQKAPLPRPAVQQEKMNSVVREKMASERGPGSGPSTRPIQVIGGKPRAKKKGGNLAGIIIAISVIILLIGAGVAYFLMM